MTSWGLIQAEVQAKHQREERLQEAARERLLAECRDRAPAASAARIVGIGELLIVLVTLSVVTTVIWRAI